MFRFVLCVLDREEYHYTRGGGGENTLQSVIDLEMSIVFLNKHNFRKRISFRKIRTMDERNESFRAMKKLSFLKNE